MTPGRENGQRPWTIEAEGLPPVGASGVAYPSTPGTRTRTKTRTRSTDSLPSPPDPGPGVPTEEEPDLLELALDEYKKGKLVPVEVELGELPTRAGPAMVAIATHMQLLMGLRRAMGDDRPLPYAASLPVQEGFVADKRNASKTIQRLVAFGVVDHVGSMPPLRPGLDGTKLYAPPGGKP